MSSGEQTPETNCRLMLLSNSTTYGYGFLEHCLSDLEEFLQSCRKLVFVPFAIRNWDSYTVRVRDALRRTSIKVVGLHEAGSLTLHDDCGIFVGGGNTFRLLKTLYDRNLLGAIRDAVLNGAKYVGSSAGANIAGVNIKTTNDMPIVEVPSYDALGLVRFNLNPHYLDSKFFENHMGETRDERIREFHEENSLPVVALREGCWLVENGGCLVVRGANGGRVFKRNHEAIDFGLGDNLSEII